MNTDLEMLWNEAQPTGQRFCRTMTEGLPEAAQRYLCHTFAEGAVIPAAVRLEMEGEIRLREWCRFRAVQVIRKDGELLWKATVWMHGLPVHGFDSLHAHEGSMQWKLFGLFPVAQGAGPHVTRSTAGRMEGEAIWLPSLFLDPAVRWSQEEGLAVAHMELEGEPAAVRLTLNGEGALQSLLYQRWGDPDQKGWGMHPFGGVMLEETSAAGLTIPSRVSIGWEFGTPQFEAGGEFFRGHLTKVEYR